MSATLNNDFLPGCGCSACAAAANHNHDSVDLNSYPGTTEGNQAVSTDLGLFDWGTTTLYYKFITSTPSYYDGSDKEQNNFSAFNTTMQDATLRILEHIEDFTNINFSQTTNEDSFGVLTFGQATREASVGGHAFYPSGNNKGGDVWLNNVHAYNQTPVEGSYGFYVLLHEIGHALGLQHSFDVYSGSEATSQFSVMAYNTTPYLPVTFQLYDIATLQDLYGANTSHRTGDDVYILSETEALTIWDAGGNDTFDASHVSSNVVLDLTEGSFSTVGLSNNVAIAYGVTIENANGGSGDDVIAGNSADNILNGNAGNDEFFESAGNDVINGGTGDDTMTFSSALSSYAIAFINSLTLSVQNIATMALATINSVENFIFNNVSYTLSELNALFGMEVIEGDSSNNGLLGNDNDERFEGYAGDDKFYAMAGNDIVNAGLGNDEVLGGSGNDTINGDGGDDIIYGGIGLDIIDGGIGNDRIWGEDGDDQLTGGDGNDVVSGGSGDDIINGNDGNDELLGGLGIDMINGGSGDDLIRADHGNDIIEGSAGNDEIYAGDGDDLIRGGADNDMIMGDAGNDEIYGDDGNNSISGGLGDDVIYGGSGDDVIYGALGNDTIYGGTGLDFLYGNDGNDIFVLDNDSSADTWIMDFDTSEDRFDLSSLLTGYDSLSDSISDFLDLSKIIGPGSRYALSVDLDGAANGENFVQIATVRGLRRHDAQDLEDNGLLIL
ncbi:MAG: M10 family metallopeptidase C-terminal domain-containing protein [Pseudomonadota bacterium]